MSPQLPSNTQAIITSYKFGCCGRITEWQTYVQPGGRGLQYSISFQVWRKSSAMDDNGCYSMVGENRFPRIMLGEGGLVSETPEPSNIIAVQPGDVVGYYTLAGNGNGGIQLDRSNSDDIVWYHKQNVSNCASDNCPNPGTQPEVMLISSTNAAPVLSVSIGKWVMQNNARIQAMSDYIEIRSSKVKI